MTTNIFVPRYRYISGITNEQYAVVTFTDTHDFVLNEIISFRVTKPYGMFEINNKQAKVLEIGDFTVTIDIDTSNFNTFIYPVSGQNTPPSCVPVASGINKDNPYFVFTILDDEFDNVRVS
jgi:hypothetical protein